MSRPVDKKETLEEALDRALRTLCQITESLESRGLVIAKQQTK